MIVEYVRYRIPEGRREAFLGAYRAASKSLDASEHCKGYELTQCEEEPDRFVLRIIWTSIEAHMKGFRSSAEFQSFLRHVRVYLDAIEEMQHYQLTDIRSGSTD